VRFWGVSRSSVFGQGSSKTPLKLKHFCKKSMSGTENFPPEIEKIFDVSFSSAFFCFIAFSGVSQQWEFKDTLQKNGLQKRSRRKAFTIYNRKRPQKNWFFFSVLFITFLGSGPPTHHGATGATAAGFRFSFFAGCRPLGAMVDGGW
jgi:hypothetical protein